MPGAISTFKDEHSWKDSENVSCTGCHSAEASALENSDNYHHDAEALGVGTTDDACKYCHLIKFEKNTFEVKDNDEKRENKNVHSTLTIECLDCHSITGPHSDPNTVSVEKDFNYGSIESHMPFYERALESDRLAGANEACVACHTGAAKTSSQKYFSETEIDLTIFRTLASWEIELCEYEP